MRILLTNDDGIHAEGLATLERIARTLSDDVWVVAPEHDQSGFAHSLSLSDPLRLRKIGEKHFAVRGTPTDCVIMGCKKILPELPDLILSGVNSGSNIADDVTYSGTVAGAMEGALLGIRSIALSQAYIVRDEERVVPWETAEALAPALLDRLIGTDLPRRRVPQRQFSELPARRGRRHDGHHARQADLRPVGRRSAPTAAAFPITGCASAARRRPHDRRHRHGGPAQPPRVGDAVAARPHRP